jgi:hypothetical protein
VAIELAGAEVIAMLSEDRLGAAMRYLATTDEEAAKLKVEVARSEYRCKLTRASVFLESEGSVEARKAQAEVSERVQKAEDQLMKALGAYEHMKAKRATEEWIVEVWRSMNANRRQGNVT